MYLYWKGHNVKKDKSSLNTYIKKLLTSVNGRMCYGKQGGPVFFNLKASLWIPFDFANKSK